MKNLPYYIQNKTLTIDKVPELPTSFDKVIDIQYYFKEIEDYSRKDSQNPLQLFKSIVPNRIHHEKADNLYTF